MKHLILSREYPPAVYAPGGIGTYAAHISKVLAERGETVHVIGQRWDGASERVERLCEGRLIIHRVAIDDVELYPSLLPPGGPRDEIGGMLRSDFPAQWFSWVAAGLAEQLIASEGIDVIEAQEWEAPLYYFLLRRTIGLGPKAKPPCIVHLHSPTEFIFRHNDWSLSRPDYYPMKRLEDFAIHAADAHMCPSHFLAEQCRSHYGLPDVEVIPLPLGTTKQQSRSPETWANGSIFFSGRLEPRKGVIEFVDAAITLAREEPGLRFDFVGSDNEFNRQVSVRTLLEQRIPPELRSCFRFHGGKPRDELMQLLGQARIAVVPSRWENFPNTCLEAMCSGVPVVATRNGGMAEMIEDGVTGWLAPDGPEPLSDRLTTAMRRALAATPEQLAAVGARGASAIRALCNNETIAERHAAFRSRIARRGAETSLRFPEPYPWPERTKRPVPVRSAGPRDGGTAVVVLAVRNGDPAETLRTLSAQTRAPASITVVSPRQLPSGSLYDHLSYDGGSSAAAKRLALQALPPASRWLFLDPYSRLEPQALELLEAALDAVPNAGLVSSWSTAQTADYVVHGEPAAFPYQWLHNEVQGPVLYRAEAIEDVGGFSTEVGEGHEDWDLVTRIMASGWAAPCVPALLSTRMPGSVEEEAAFGQASHASATIAARFPELAGEDVISLLLMTHAPTKRLAMQREWNHSPVPQMQNAFPPLELLSVRQILALPFPQKLAISMAVATEPRKAAAELLLRGRLLLQNIRARYVG